jgi:3-deoxy-D-manno-octulosonate 8-phosphate phosphatase (KDO 8-P phosphatase)
MKKINNSLKEKFKKLKLLILDVDGVLTDNSIIIDDNGIESKRFNISDGLGIYLAKKAGIEVALISGRDSKATRVRAKELKIKNIYLGENHKIVAFEKIKNKLKVKDKEICFMGDDILDLPLLKKVGVPITVKGSNPVVEKSVLYVTFAKGGEGAVREVIDLILKSKNINPGELI